MIGMLLWSREVGSGFSEKSVCGVRFLCAEVSRKAPEILRRRRVCRVLRRMEKLGIRRLVLPEAFPYRELLEAYRLCAVSTRSLRCALAADWVDVTAKRLGLGRELRIAVVGDRLDQTGIRTVTDLALRYRYVMLDTPDGEALCRKLRRSCGVTLPVAPDRRQIAGADVLLLFREYPEAGNGAVLPLYEQEDGAFPPLLLSPEIEEELPEGVDRWQCLAALDAAGALRPGMVTLGAKS